MKPESPDVVPINLARPPSAGTHIPISLKVQQLLCIRQGRLLKRACGASGPRTATPCTIGKPVCCRHILGASLLGCDIKMLARIVYKMTTQKGMRHPGLDKATQRSTLVPIR